METNTVNIVTRRLLITIEKDLMTVLMRITVEAVAVRLVMITEQTQTEMEIIMPM